MKKLLFLLMVSLLVTGSVVAQNFEVGGTYHGFKLIDKKFVKEVNSECYVFVHTASGIG